MLNIVLEHHFCSMNNHNILLALSIKVKLAIATCVYNSNSTLEDRLFLLDPHKQPSMPTEQ